MDREERLDVVITDYLQAAEAGRPLDETEWLARHADLADELRAFLADQRSVERIAGPLRPPSPTPPVGQTEQPTLAHGTAPVDADAAARSFGDYELLGEIARGGMGVVYRARQKSLNRIVALKMILAGPYAGAMDVRRFQLEAEAAAALDHPHIVPIYEVGTHDGQPYFSMKLIEGGSLANASLPRERGEDDRPVLPPLTREARLRNVQCIETVARAVHFAHQRGILHRDLKPANILMDAHGTPYVSDFGLARRLDADAGATQSGAIVGTPSYMAPEQARAEKTLTVAADVWALGAILYERLTGAPPFQAATPLDTLMQVLDREPEPPSRRCGGLPRDLETICMKCLQKDPARRYATAADLADDLERFREGRPIAARPVGALERGWRWCRRNPAVASLSAVAVMCLVAGASFAVAFGIHANRRATEAEQANVAKDTAITQMDGLRLVARSELERPRDPVAGLLLAVEGAERGRPRTHLHNNALLAAILACNERRSFDGERVLAAVRQGPASVEHHICMRDAQLSADGRRLLTLADTAQVPAIQERLPFLQVWDVKTGAMRPIVHSPQFGFGIVRFSPDGQRIAVTVDAYLRVRHGDGRESVVTPCAARIWDANTGKERAVLKGHTGQITSAVFSTDSKRLLTASLDGSARVWDTATGASLVQIDAAGERLRAARFSADGQRVLTWALGANAAIPGGADRPRGKAAFDPPLVDDPQAKVVDAWGQGFDPSGQREGPPPRLWDATTGKPIATLAEPARLKEPIAASAVSGDGRIVVTARSRADYSNVETRWFDVWDGNTAAALGKIARTFNMHHVVGGIDRLSLSAAGDRLLVVYRVQTASAWDPRYTQILEVIDVGSKRLIAQRVLTVEKRPTRQEGEWELHVRHAELSPDGKHVLLLRGNAERVRQRYWSVWFGDHKYSLQDGVDPVVHLWDLERNMMTRLLGHDNDIAAAHFSADGRHIVTAGLEGNAKLWDVVGGAGAVRVLDTGNDSISIARFSPDGHSVATARGRLEFPAAALLPFIEHSPQRQPDVRSVRLWDAATGKQTAALVGLASMKDQGWRERLLGSVVDVAFSPDGKRLLVWSQDMNGKTPGPDGKRVPAPFTPIRLWDHATGREAIALAGLTQLPQQALFSPDGRHLLTVAISQKLNIDVAGQGGKIEWGGVEPRDREQLWDAATGKHLGRFGPDDLVAQALWSPDNRRVYLICKNGGQIWDALAGKQLAGLEGIAMSRAAISPDGKRLVGFYHYFDKGRLDAVVWDADTGKKTATLAGHAQEILAAAFSKDSRTIVTTSADATVRIWDAGTGKVLHVLRSHRAAVRSVAFSADGRWLVTASDDGTARIWDAGTWEEWLTLSGHAGPVYAAEFSPNATQVVTASRDGTARLWPVDPLPAARARRPRALTDAERQRFDVRVRGLDTSSG